MKYLVLFTIAISFFIISCIQKKPLITNITTDNRSESEIIDSLNNEQNAFPYPLGGVKDMQSKLVYPKVARINNIEGRVIVKTWINSIGEVTRTEILDGIGYGCDEEAMRVIKSTKFIPGKTNWDPINIIVEIPIVFILK